MENVCRTCMNDSVLLVNIFSEVRDPALEQPNRSFAHILSECTNRSVTPDDCQSQFICLACIQAAQIAYRFKRQCDRTYQHFCELQARSSTTQDQDNQPENGPQAEQKPVTRASRRSGGTNHRQLELPQSINGTEGMGKRFGCPQCLKTYKYKHNLTRHLLIHNSKPTHQCTHCSKGFWRKDSFIGHMRSCRWRTTTISNVSQLEHNDENPLSLPDLLPSRINDVDMINMETSLVSRPSVYKHICVDCLESFDQEDDLKMHILLNHDLNISSPEESLTLGRDCEPRFRTLSQESTIESSEDIQTSRKNESGFDQETQSSEQSEKQNRLRKSERKRFVCPYCKCSFNMKTSLERHIATHDEEDSRTCRHCGAIFSELSVLKLHLRDHEEKAVHVPDLPDSMENNNNSEDTNINANISLRTWDLPVLDLSLDSSRKICDENRSTSSQRDSGFDQETPISMQGEKQHQCLMPNGDKKWMACPHCPRRFQNKDSMQRHIYTHICQPRYKCPICQKTYHRNDCYSRHLRTHNDDGGAVYICNQCPAAFIDRFSLTRHNRKLHGSDVKTHGVVKCRYCGKKYQKIKSLQKHERGHL